MLYGVRRLAKWKMEMSHHGFGRMVDLFGQPDRDAIDEVLNLWNDVQNDPGVAPGDVEGEYVVPDHYQERIDRFHLSDFRNDLSWEVSQQCIVTVSCFETRSEYALRHDTGRVRV